MQRGIPPVHFPGEVQDVPRFSLDALGLRGVFLSFPQGQFDGLHGVWADGVPGVPLAPREQAPGPADSLLAGFCAGIREQVHHPHGEPVIAVAGDRPHRLG